ncbi:Rrf2 family transcriptional regulator [Euzebya sp.]|uniref:RrF2 family transcriptional regulator n=1 Tax=Euzebya sp. TaxID=1971409 RepID=UPI003514C844
MRLEITRKTDLALRALQLLARAEGRVKARDIAADIGSTPGFTTQVLAPLAHAGWVSTAFGPTGGYAIEAPGRTGSLLALIELMEGPVADGRCVLEDGLCMASGPCALHEAWDAARTAMVGALAARPAVPPAGGEG